MNYKQFLAYSKFFRIYGYLIPLFPNDADLGRAIRKEVRIREQGKLIFTGSLGNDFVLGTNARRVDSERKDYIKELIKQVAKNYERDEHP